MCHARMPLVTQQIALLLSKVDNWLEIFNSVFLGFWFKGNTAVALVLSLSSFELVPFGVAVGPRI